MSAEEIKKMADQLEMFKKGFESITKNIEAQIEKFEKEVNQLAKNTEPIMKVKDNNKIIHNKLQSVSMTLGELMRRLDIIEHKSYQ